MTYEEFQSGMAIIIAEKYPRTFPKETINAYWLGLQDLDAKSFQSAVVQFLRSGDDWPSVSKLRRLAGEPAPIDPDGRAAIILAELSRIRVAVSSPVMLDFADPIAHKTIRLSRALYHDNPNSDPVFESKFRRLYREIWKTGFVSEADAEPVSMGTESIQGQRKRIQVQTGLPPIDQKRITGPAVEAKRLEGVTT